MMIRAAEPAREASSSMDTTRSQTAAEVSALNPVDVVLRALLSKASEQLVSGRAGVLETDPSRPQADRNTRQCSQDCANEGAALPDGWHIDLGA